MLPDFLGGFRPQLEAYKLDYLKILATPLSLAASLPLAQSKFLGTPFLPVGTPHPLDANGKPMLLLAQINFAEAPALEQYPRAGILQLFVSPTEWYNMEDYCVLYHPDPTVAAQTDFSFLTDALYEDSPIYVEHSLAFSKETAYGGAEDYRFAMDFDGNTFDEYLETLPQAQQNQLEPYFDGAGHKIGGYAYFTQSDPRTHDPAPEPDVLLLQIDTDEQIMFGDSGVANVFISPEALRNKQFDQAYFHWDCC
jgi:uncharacterized protein YwqG